jgi:hypothetical protein
MDLFWVVFYRVSCRGSLCCSCLISLVTAGVTLHKHHEIVSEDEATGSGALCAWKICLGSSPSLSDP